MMLSVLFARIGDSDCEVLDSGFLVQPSNAVSSLAYSLAGLALLVWAFRVSGQSRIARIVFAASMIATGIGSVLFHGPQGWGSQFLHDMTFLTALIFLAVLNFNAAVSTKASTAWVSLGTLWLVVVVVLAISPGATNAVMIVAVVGVVVSDVMLFRGEMRWTRWYLAALVAGIAAVAMFVLGRTDGLLCDPTATFQGHAVWHVLGAIALSTYFVATSVVREARSESWTR